MARFNILNKAEKVLSYTYLSTQKCQKKLRCDLVPTMRNSALEIVKYIIRANQYNLSNPIEREKRLELQNEAKIEIRVLESIADSAHMLSYITKEQLEFLTKLLYELYSMLERWIESDASRCTV